MRSLADRPAPCLGDSNYMHGKHLSPSAASAYKRYGVSTSSSAPAQVTCDESQRPSQLCLSPKNKLLGPPSRALQQLPSSPAELLQVLQRIVGTTSTPPHPRPLSAPKRRPLPLSLSRTAGLWRTLVGGAGIKEWHSCTTPPAQSPNEERFQVSGCPPLVD